MGFVLLLVATNAYAGQVSLAWDPVSSANLGGYRLYYGAMSHTYAAHIDVGTQTSYTVVDLVAGLPYYFAVTAYDLTGTESAPSNEVSITIDATALVAAFSAIPTSGQTPLTVAFTDASTGRITAWAWDFGDGSSSTIPLPIHTYTTPGTYSVRLTVSGPDGSDTATKAGYIQVNAGQTPAPVAAFSAIPTSGQAPLTVAFIGESTGSITAWAWDFGDGSSSTIPLPIHTYTTPGIYSVQLTVSGPDGSATATKAGYIQVNAGQTPAPVAAFSAIPTSGQAPLTVAFTDASTGSITAWVWDFGDGNSSTTPPFIHTYTTPGTYSVRLTVSGPDGSATATKAGYIQVNAGQTPAPVAAFSAIPTSGQAPLTVVFIGTSTGSITAWAWDFGDGSSSALPLPIHTYTTPGTYSVRLTVSGPAGSATATKAGYIQVNARQTTLAWDSANSSGGQGPVTGALPPTKAGSIPVTVPPPVAQFSANLSSGRLPVTVAFTDASAGSITGWAWDFGDGTPRSPLRSPTHTYTIPGTYSVQLTVTGPDGSATVTKPHSITVAPAIVEVGELTVDYLWKRITLRQPFVDPIVVATSLSSNDFAPATIRIRNVEPTGFEIRVQEWDYLDGVHAPETVSYLAMERGPHTLGTGIRVEAERMTTNRTTTFAPVTFRQSFAVAPVVLTAVTSVTAADGVTARVRRVTSQGFEVHLQEQSSHGPSPTIERIDYIVWEPSSGTVDGLTFEVKTTPDVVTDQVYPIRLIEPFLTIPMFLAGMQTTNSDEPATLRWDNKGPVGVDIQLQEEGSLIHNLAHTNEVVGYMAFTYQ